MPTRASSRSATPTCSGPGVRNCTWGRASHSRTYSRTAATDSGSPWIRALVASRTKPKIAGAVSPTAVSYTHLDVYKRKDVEGFGGGLWSISALTKVGAAVVGDVELAIAPKVPIGRLIFLLGYAASDKGWLAAAGHFGTCLLYTSRCV